MLNAALALEVSGAVRTALEGLTVAQGAIDCGDAARLLGRLAEFGRRLGTGH
jgi:anthranilate phosphoribosyltransferase